MADYQNQRNFWFITEKAMVIYKNNLSLWTSFIAWEIRFIVKKQWFYWKNYGTMEKTMELFRKTMELWFTMKKKIWYYGGNYGTRIHYSKL